MVYIIKNCIIALKYHKNLKNSFQDVCKLTNKIEWVGNKHLSIPC